VFWGPNYELPLRVKGVRYVLTIHDLALLINSKWGDKRTVFTLKFMAPLAVRRADFLLADSESTKQDMIRLCHIREQKIRTIYLGGYEDQTHLVSAQGLAAAKAKYGIAEKYFFFVGTIEPRKNINTLVSAFELLAAKDPEVQLVIAGGIGWNCDDVLQQIKNSVYADRILQVGYVDKQEKLDLYAGAAAYVLPSHYEGFGLPILEAMSLGGIVITANNSSLLWRYLRNLA
jgi:glycosyltransferase involved in cell wall biosynthesis